MLLDTTTSVECMRLVMIWNPILVVLLLLHPWLDRCLVVLTIGKILLALQTPRPFRTRQVRCLRLVLALTPPRVSLLMTRRLAPDPMPLILQPLNMRL